MNKSSGQLADAPVVISASRMTDMPRYYPVDLICEVMKRVDKGLRIHTLVMWTKHPNALLTEPLYSFLHYMQQQDTQLFLQCTITGMGGRAVEPVEGRPMLIEPQAPTWEEAVAVLPKVIELLGKPERLHLRIDPLVRVRDKQTGEVFSNLALIPGILNRVGPWGIRRIIFSILEPKLYPKVDRRFNTLGWEIIESDRVARDDLKAWLHQLEADYNVEFRACCVEGFPDNACIDGSLLSQLHERGWKADTKILHKRVQCGCTKSIDIGGWPPKLCHTGCQYCYSRSSYGRQ